MACQVEEKKWTKKKEKAVAEGNFDNLYYCCKELADLYVEKEDYESALTEYEQCEDAARSCGDDIRLAVANRMIGEMYCYLNDFNSAIKHQQIHLKISQTKNDIVEQQRALATLGRTHYLLSEMCDNNNEDDKKSRALNKSVMYYLKSLEVCSKLSKEVGTKTLSEMKGRLYLNLSLCEESSGDISKSMDYINKALKIYFDSDLTEELCRCYSIKSSLYSKLNNFSKAISCVDHGLQLASRLQNKKVIGTELLLLKADLLVDINDYQTAKSTMIKAYKLKVPLKDEFEEVEKKLKILAIMCKTENNLLVASQNDYEKRKELNEKLGDACVALNKYSKAIAYYEKMLENSERYGINGKDLVPCYVSLAQTYKDNKQYYQALEYFNKELNVYDRNSIEACKTLLNIAECMELLYDPLEKIWPIYEEAKSIAKNHNDGHLQLSAVKGMKCLAENRDKTDMIIALNEELNYLMKFETDSPDLEKDVPEIWDEISVKDLSDFEDEENDKRRKRHKLTTIPEKKNEKGETPIIPACAKGNVKLVLSLLKQGHSVNAGDALGWTALHEASNYGHVDIVNVLLDHGADINHRGGPGCDGITPLHDAAACGHLEVIDCLLDRGANPLVRTNKGETPLDCLIACRNRVIIEEKRELSPDRLAHFWAIVDRLSDCLRKAGHIPAVPPINVEEILKNKEKPEDNYLGIIPDNRRQNKKCSKTITKKEENFKEVEDFNAAEEYKNTINQLRNNNKRRRDNNEILYEISQPPLVEHSVDDWLEEDIIYKPKKKHCGEKSGGSASPTMDVLFEDDTNDCFEDDNKLENMITDFETKNESSPLLISDEDSNDFSICNKNSDNTSLINKLKQNEIYTNKYKPLLLSTSNKKSQQSKLEHQGFVSIKAINSKSHLDSNGYVSETGVNSIKKEDTLKNVNSTIKVRVENRLFLIPIPDTEQNLNLKWLATEASRRYHKLESVTPVLNLTTEDGAILDENDPINLIIGFQEIIGVVVGWSTESLTDMYKKSSVDSNVIFDEKISQHLEVLQATGMLNMSNHIFKRNSLNIALNVACHYQSLKVLCLSGIAFEDSGMKLLSENLSNLQQLNKLDISCNNISSNGLSSWATIAIKNKSLISLEFLDLSYNPICNDGLSNLRTIIQCALNLRSLILRNVDIDQDCYDYASELYLDNLEELDLSYNKLGRTGVSGFFTRLDPMNLKYLNVCNTGTSMVLRECVLFLERSQADRLHSIDLSSLDLDDEDIDVLCNCLGSVGNLENLWLTNNPRVTQISLERIKHLSVKFVYMAGCKPVDISSVENISLEKMSLSAHGHSNLFKDAPYNVKISL
ncbi:tonsoku-like protein [Daktulosphaira vitifoliae]|uniref:tonsoku-like protein n=1 Tax=Daktulosphaira vitifoliae TaxID=58002 RepID=UPI0021A98F2E|nr:tonsoku-like protein [Daktulosphaira vitifoliae]